MSIKRKYWPRPYRWTDRFRIRRRGKPSLRVLTAQAPTITASSTGTTILIYGVFGCGPQTP